MKNRSLSAIEITIWALALAALALAALTLIGGPQAFTRPTVSEILDKASSVKPVEDTRALCANNPCVEGWRTEVGNFIRFERLGQAEYWSTVLGDDCRRVGRVLVDFTGMNLTTNQKKVAVDLIYQGKDWF